ncbi:hypothetical protein [Methanosarcina sp. 1.H.T.1A.1]
MFRNTVFRNTVFRNTVIPVESALCLLRG